MNDKERLILSIKESLDKNLDELIFLSCRATGNSLSDTQIDIERSLRFLGAYNEKDIPQNLKAKGTILIILSYNEPLLLSVVPVICALLVGNKVIVRPSSKNIELFNKIWSNIPKEFSNKIQIENFDISNLENYVKLVKAVFFFGSFNNAKRVYELCSKYFVEFIPEIEAGDCKVLNVDSISNKNIQEDIKSTFKNSYDHSGIICQRFSGVFINRSIYKIYLDNLNSALSDKKYEIISKDNNNLLEKEILESLPSYVWNKDDEYVVINPKANSEFVKNAYFLKLLWVIPFDNYINLIDMLNSRNFFLGLNIKSNDTNFINELIKDTNYSRYTLNNNHTDIKDDTGWGGNWPSGVGGYKTWYETFSNKFIILK